MQEYVAEGVGGTSCSYCGGRLREDIVQAAFWGLEGMIAIKDIPARLCERCGEQFYDEETTSLIHRLIGARRREIAASEEVIVPVYSLTTMRELLGDPRPVRQASEEE